MIDLDTISALEAAGFSFLASVDVPEGKTTLLIKGEDIPAFMADKDATVAQYMGVSKQKYLMWLATEGTPRCGATTVEGSRCRNYVSGGIHLPIEEWMRLEGGKCAVHGGETSQEAHSRIWLRR